MKITRLAYERKEQGWSQVDLADEVPMNQVHYGLLERGRLVPKPEHLTRLGELLKVEPPSALLELVEVKTSWEPVA